MFENYDGLPDQVEDGLHREDELGNRVWRHQVSDSHPPSNQTTMEISKHLHLQVSLEELEAATASQPVVLLDMEKTLDKKPTFVNKSRKTLGRLWSRLLFSSSIKCLKLNQPEQ